MGLVMEQVVGHLLTFILVIGQLLICGGSTDKSSVHSSPSGWGLASRSGQLAASEHLGEK